jgi:hypothetical protein
MKMIDSNQKDWVLSLAKETSSWYTRPDCLPDDEGMHISEGLKKYQFVPYLRTAFLKDRKIRTQLWISMDISAKYLWEMITRLRSHIRLLRSLRPDSTVEGLLSEFHNLARQGYEIRAYY